VPKTEDGLRRVNLERTMGKMKIEVLGRDRHSLTLGITYDGVCSGLWHPGVATILCMDVALDVKGRRMSWTEDSTAGWAVTGTDAFGGLYSEASPPGSLSRKSSFESIQSSTFLSTLANRPLVTPARGTASLLRAPLPNESTPEYSFETSPSGASPTVGPSNNPKPSASQETRMSRPDVAPGKPVTLKVNLLKLLPPAQNELCFSIRGIVSIDVEEEDFVPLPTFHVLGSDREKIDAVVSSHATDTIVQVGSQVANNPRRTLRVGDEVRCEEGVGLVLRPWESPAGPSSSPSVSRTPASSRIHMNLDPPHVEAPSSAVTMNKPPRTQQPSDLPCVLTTVTPLVDSTQHTHCVRVHVPFYSLDADTIEFGLALPQQSAALARTPGVDVLYASYAGRQVHAELRPRRMPPRPIMPDAQAESQIVGEIQFLVVVHLEDVEADAGPVEVVYLVGDNDSAPRSIAAKNKGKGKEDIGVDVLLPCFELPVARYEVEIDCPSSASSILYANHVISETCCNRLYSPCQVLNAAQPSRHAGKGSQACALSIARWVLSSLVTIIGSLGEYHP
jgi:hypothetical protein